MHYKQIVERLHPYWLIGFLALGTLYAWTVHVSVSDPTYIDSQKASFAFTVYSPISQTVKLHVHSGSRSIYHMRCDGQEVELPSGKKRWHEAPGEEVAVALKAGETECKASIMSHRRISVPKVVHKVDYVDFTLLYLLVGTPLVYMLYRFFLWVLNCFSLSSPASRPVSPTIHLSIRDMIFWIIVAGIVLRVLLYLRYSSAMFQHDWHGHVEFIHYMAEHWSFPVADKGLQFPQQPLYYLLTAPLYLLLTYIGFPELWASYGVGVLSLFASAVFLLYAYRFFVLMGLSKRAMRVAMVFLAFTPSLIYMGVRVNNDALVMALAAMALYYSVSAYHYRSERHAYYALATVSALFMTKISTAGYELFLMALLMGAYLRTVASGRGVAARNIWWFAWVGIFLLSFTLLRLYLPGEAGVHLHMVNSSGVFPRQSLPPLESSYFFTFHFEALLEAAQSHVYGDDRVRFSLPTYQFGTMLFGEFDYTKFHQAGLYMREVMQLIYLLALFWVILIVTGILKNMRGVLVEKLLVGLFVINALLIVKFIADYPSVCNSDFRYFVPSFVLVAYFIARGIEVMEALSSYLTMVLEWIVAVLVLFEVLFMMQVILYQLHQFIPFLTILLDQGEVPEHLLSLI